MITPLLALLLATLPAHDKFGDTGALVPSGGIGLFHGSGTTTFSFSPQVQYFVAPNVAVGVGLTYAHQAGDNAPTFDSYGGLVSFGVNLPFGEQLSIFPSVFFTGVHTSISGSAFVIGGPSSAIGAAVFVPLLFHPVPHMFLGFGPEFATSGPSSDLFHDQAVSLHTIIGAWF